MGFIETLLAAAAVFMLFQIEKRLAELYQLLWEALKEDE